MAKNGVFLRLERRERMLDDISCGNDSEKVHVLAVDDSLVDRKVIEGLLRITSFKVTAVDSGWRALQFLGLDRDENSVELDRLKVDLIITDYCMPGMTGYELMKKIKGSSTFRKVPVVIMSSENVLARTLRCLEEGAEDFIVKPVKLSDIKRLKRAMFGEGSNDDSMKKPDDNSEKPPPAQSPSPLPSIDSTPSSSFPNSPQSDWPLLLSPTSPLPLLKDKDVEGNPSMDHPHSLLEILLNGKDCDRNTPKDSQSPPLEILLEDKDIDRNPPKDQHSSLEAILVDKDNDDRNAPKDCFCQNKPL